MKINKKISKGIESLFANIAADEEAGVCDVLIVGSGYGGAIAADCVAGHTFENDQGRQKPLKVVVLERGDEFKPGDFPGNETELPKFIRLANETSRRPYGRMNGLYDLRFGKDLLVAQANGLGGGSLINAGVMKRAATTVFQSGWPKELIVNQPSDQISDNGSGVKANTNLAETKLDKEYKEAETLLGSQISDKKRNTIDIHPKSDRVLKTQRLQELSPKLKIDKEALTVAMTENQTTVAGVRMHQCKLCGDCVTGCNFGAKISLDYTVLHRAYRKNAEIYTGASVLRFRKDVGDFWLVDVVYTDPVLRKRDPVIRSIKTRFLVVSAGALGSTELLNISESNRLKFSHRLGRGFSSNGDMWLVGFNQNKEANALANETVAHEERYIGPTITATLDLRESKVNIAYQEMAVPAAFWRTFGETFKTADTIYSLRDPDCSDHKNVSDVLDPSALNPSELKRTSLYAAMTDDDADGALRLAFRNNSWRVSDDDIRDYVPGTLFVNWPGLKYKKSLDEAIKKLESLSENTVGGRVLPSPTWRPIPVDNLDESTELMGPPVSVHPLGGCGMGDDVEAGVVNSYGQVFNPLDRANGKESVHSNLFVMDGSIVPKSLGVNPALTITALSMRAANKLMESISNTLTNVQEIAAYEYHDVNQIDHQNESKSEKRTPTKTHIVERMSGPLDLIIDGQKKKCILEFTLKSESKEFAVVKTLFDQRILLNQDTLDYERQDEYSPQGFNQVRIYEKEKWNKLQLEDRSSSAVVNGAQEREHIEDRLESIAIYRGRVKGQFTILSREPSTAIGRVYRATCAWLINRGTKDIHRALMPNGYERKPLFRRREESSTNLLQKARSWLRGTYKTIRSILVNASNAGEIRLLKYELQATQVRQVGDIELGELSFDLEKIFSYQKYSNPLNQLSEAKIVKFDHSGLNIEWEASRKFEIKLDTHYLFRQRLPLFEITEQDNLVTSTLDVFSFFAYLARQTLKTHFWSFRTPDIPNPIHFDRKRRFANLKSLHPNPTTIDISIATPAMFESNPNYQEYFSMRLIGFRHTSPNSLNTVREKAPVLLIHGYSASSSSFAHPALPKSLAEELYENGHDVWTLDLRTSSAFDSSRIPWRFEDIAEHDIPKAVTYLFHEVYKSQTKINILGHCMGAAMLSMAILKNHAKGMSYVGTPFTPKDMIESICLSQGSPALALTPDNTFKSLLGSYVKEIFPHDYQYRPDKPLVNLTDILLDRIIAALPYPDEEEERRFPWWKPCKRQTYKRTRYRMDALLGRTFDLRNMSDETLNHIDELFGPMSIETMTQIMHFAECQTVTNRQGHNHYVSLKNLTREWGGKDGIPTLVVQAKNNGVVDATTLNRTKNIFRECGVPAIYHMICNEQIGHQDSIIGIAAHEVFDIMADFFEAPAKSIEKEEKLTETASTPHGVWMPTVPKYGPMIIPTDQPGSYKVAAGSDEIQPEVAILVLIPCEFRGEQVKVDLTTLDYALWVGLEGHAGHIERMKSGREFNWLETHLDTSKHATGLFLPLFLHEGTKNLGHGFGRDSSSQDAQDILDHYYSEEALDEARKLLNKPRFVPMTSRGDGADFHYSQMKIRDATESNIIASEFPGEFEQLMGSKDNEAEISGEHNAKSGSGMAHGNIHSLIKKLRGLILEYFNSSTIDRNELISVNPEVSNPKKFAVGSCQYPAGFIDKKPAYESYKELSKFISSSDAKKTPSLLVLLGDQIYSDATSGLFDPRNFYDKYNRPYFKHFRQEAVKLVHRRLPVSSMLDDHEIEDNWEPITESRTTHASTTVKFDPVKHNEQVLRDGLSSFKKFQRADFSQTSAQNNKLWYLQNFESHSFFFLDTRTNRESRSAATVGSASFISSRQLRELLVWLESQDPKKIKFICSGPIFLPRHKTESRFLDNDSGAISQDGWDGYPATMRKLIGHLYDNRIENVIFLSGDEHRDCYAKVEIRESLDQKGTADPFIIRSLHCSGLYSPIPFANSKQSNLMIEDEFELEYVDKTGVAKFLFCEVSGTFQIDEIGKQSTSTQWISEPIEVDKVSGFAIVTVN